MHPHHAASQAAAWPEHYRTLPMLHSSCLEPAKLRQTVSTVIGSTF
jgi:hypothetical protein